MMARTGDDRDGHGMDGRWLGDGRANNGPCYVLIGERIFPMPDMISEVIRRIPTRLEIILHSV